MSEPTEQQVAAVLVAHLRRLNACDPECHGRCVKCPDDTAGEAADMIERLSAAAPRQASAMSAEADRIHVRLLAMGWLDHREDNCKTATEAAKLIRELSEESAPRQADGWREPVTYLVNEVRGMLSAYEHELRHYMGHTNYNCIAERLPAVEALLRPAVGEPSDQEKKP